MISHTKGDNEDYNNHWLAQSVKSWTKSSPNYKAPILHPGTYREFEDYNNVNKRTIVKEILLYLRIVSIAAHS